ncbi:DNA topoisomerase, partial [Gorgonomyces haynaldii]
MISRILCVAEKPSISKAIAAILSDGQFTTKQTKSKFIKNYEFECRHQNQDATMVMTCVSGHLTSMEFDQQYKLWKEQTTQELFHAPVHVQVAEDMKAIEHNLIQEAKYSQMLVIWTDCDLEGEHIGSEIVSVCRKVNPRIIVKRARFSIVQHREIRQAWSQLVELDMRAAKAVEARSELDLRIGAVFTRFQSLLLKPRFGELKDVKFLSFGSCQFPTLGFVVERYLEAKRFIPEPFWSLEAIVKESEYNVKFKWQRDRLYNEQAIQAFYDLCHNKQAKIVKVEAKPKSKWAPLPLTTIELQKSASKFLGMTSDRVMSVAEKLYNEGIISYPRTETDVFGDTFDLMTLVQKQLNSPQPLSQYAQRLLNGEFVRPRKGKNDDQAHPPIHPVRGAAELGGDEQRVYDFIARRFLACCSKGAKGNGTLVEFDLEGEIFSATGLTITERNYLDIFPFEKWSDTHLPVFTLGQIIHPQIQLHRGETTKPSLLTESDLITLMDKSGIGTDATIHEHIKKIQDRDYCHKDGAYFVPTVLGLALVEAYDKMNIDLQFSKPMMRHLMETNIQAICNGSKTKEQVVQETVEMYKQAYQKIQRQKQVMVDCCSAFWN